MLAIPLAPTIRTSVLTLWRATNADYLLTYLHSNLIAALVDTAVCWWVTGGRMLSSIDCWLDYRQFHFICDFEVWYQRGGSVNAVHGSQPVYYRVTTVGKLFTPSCLCRCTCLMVSVDSQLSGCGSILTAIICKQPWASVLRPTQPPTLRGIGIE